MYAGFNPFSVDIPKQNIVDDLKDKMYEKFWLRYLEIKSFEPSDDFKYR